MLLEHFLQRRVVEFEHCTALGFSRTFAVLGLCTHTETGALQQPVQGHEHGLGDNVPDVRARVAVGALREVVVLLRMQAAHLGEPIDEHLAARFQPRQADVDALAKAAQHRRVELPRQVGRREHEDERLRLHRGVHLEQQLVGEALVGQRARLGRLARARDRVDFVEEEHARRGLVRTCKERVHELLALAHPARDELRARRLEKGRVDLVGDGARQHRLAGARRPVQQHRARGLDPQARKEHGVLAREQEALAQRLHDALEPANLLKAHAAFLARSPRLRRLGFGVDGGQRDRVLAPPGLGLWRLQREHLARLHEVALHLRTRRAAGGGRLPHERLDAGAHCRHVLLPRAAKGALVRLLQQARPFGHPALLRLGRLHAGPLGCARKAVYTPIAAA